MEHDYSGYIQISAGIISFTLLIAAAIFEMVFILKGKK